jgi:DNA-binding transcriptional regulator YhcF (GntR family)
MDRDPLLAALQGSSLSPFERLMFLVLASQEGPVIASRRTLAEWAGCSVRAAGRALAALESKGWITVKRRMGAGGTSLSNEYRLKIATFPRAA